ncbi:MAG TPA: hypothetical protein VGO58_19240 [Chitinophagaceae bacterium]|jgi:hypothetical protein|nr:hypothetical protein [Chitinophagaceae bacterium]
MESLSATSFTASQQQGRSLKSLVNSHLTDLIPVFARNNSFIINDVSDELKIVANPEKVGGILDQLFTTVAAHTTGSCIRITAKTYSDVILLQVRDHGMNGHTIACNLQTAQPIAETIGGFLGITSQWKNETVIVFSFPNLPVAA